jgi:lysophospholipase L1-like esterase
MGVWMISLKIFQIVIVVFSLMPIQVFAGQRPVRYAALGDSYTIGTGAQPDESWPAVVTARLRAQGIPIELVGNLGHDGWTSQNLIDGELPLLQGLKPDYVTLLIGVNDWVQGVDAGIFL